MELETFGGAAAIALIGSSVFALIGRGWIRLNRVLVPRASFASSVLPQPAQRFSDECDFLASKQSLFLASALVFAVLFSFAWLSGSARVLAGADTWMLVIVGTILAAAVPYALLRLARTVIRRRALAFRRLANVVVGQSLHKVTGSMNRVFHDVACGDGVIDHVLIGQKGIYAINVIARRAAKNNKVRARDGQLWLASGRTSVPLEGYAAASERLARRMRKAIGARVRVRTVIVVPGWEVEEQTGDECLVVNERSLVMLRGWRDRSECLMNEDVEMLHDHVAELCTRASRPAARGSAA